MGLHHSHYHIDFRPPNRVAISMSSQNLIAEVVSSGEKAQLKDPLNQDEDVLKSACLDLQIKNGEASMLILDAPISPDSAVMAMLAENNQSTSLKQKRVVGICHPIPNGKTVDRTSADNGVSPHVAALEYFRAFEKRKIEGSVEVEIKHFPSHGKLIAIEGKNYRYIPEEGYLGRDKVEFSVTIGKEIVDVVLYIQAFEGVAIGNTTIKDMCGKKGYLWKISTNTNEINNSLSWLSQSAFRQLLGDAFKITSVDTNLRGTTLSKTTGTGNVVQIALSPTAAGYGWFVDSTPDSNEEFLPTADPTIWQARPGSKTEGKMDILSVMLHEYGHALGISNSSDSHDYMAPSLAAGLRRLPTAQELALMQQLVAQIKPQTPAPTASNGSAQALRTDSAVFGQPAPAALPSPIDIPASSLSLDLLGFSRVRRAEYGWVLDAEKLQLQTRLNPAALNQAAITAQMATGLPVVES